MKYTKYRVKSRVIEVNYNLIDGKGKITALKTTGDTEWVLEGGREYEFNDGVFFSKYVTGTTWYTLSSHKTKKEAVDILRKLQAFESEEIY